MDSTAFTIFNFSVQWYGLAYFFSFLIINFYLKQSLSSKYSANIVDKITNFTFLGMIIGGRVGYVVAYDTNNLLNFSELIAVWNGGMAAYGGFIGGFIFLYIKCKIEKVNFHNFLNNIASFLPIALFLGRIANLINDEIPGKVIFQYRHPVILYSILFEGIFLFFLLKYKSKVKLLAQLSTSSLFMIFYGLIRFILDFFRETETSMLLNMTYGQIFGLGMILIGFLLHYKSRLLSEK